MRSVHKLVLAGLGLSFAMAATPAWATANTFYFDSNFNGDNSASTLTAVGGNKQFSSTVGATKITATVTAWNATKAAGATNYTLATAQLGQYDGGLGVTSAYDNYNGCGAGNCGMHQIDNLGNTAGSKSYDFVQLVFDKAVTLSAITRVAYGQVLSNSSTIYDDDFTYGSGATQAQLANVKGSTAGTLTSAGSLTTAAFSSMLDTDYSKTGQCSSAQYGVCFDGASLATTGDQWHASTVWWISASLLNPDNVSDAFKLYDFSVIYNDAPVTVASVPEPASWTMMIGGFGLIGGALRRKKAAERLVAA